VIFDLDQPITIKREIDLVNHDRNMTTESFRTVDAHVRDSDDTVLYLDEPGQESILHALLSSSCTQAGNQRMILLVLGLRPADRHHCHSQNARDRSGG
jgi:hypothetical protein